MRVTRLSYQEVLAIKNRGFHPLTLSACEPRALVVGSIGLACFVEVFGLVFSIGYEAFDEDVDFARRIVAFALEHSPDKRLEGCGCWAQDEAFAVVRVFPGIHFRVRIADQCKEVQRYLSQFKQKFNAPAYVDGVEIAAASLAGFEFGPAKDAGIYSNVREIYLPRLGLTLVLDADAGAVIGGFGTTPDISLIFPRSELEHPQVVAPQVQAQAEQPQDEEVDERVFGDDPPPAEAAPDDVAAEVPEVRVEFLDVSSPLPTVSSSRVVRVTGNVVRNARGTAGMREYEPLLKRIEAFVGGNEVLTSVALVLASWKVAGRGAPAARLIAEVINSGRCATQREDVSEIIVRKAVRRIAQFGLRVFIDADPRISELNLRLEMLFKRRGIADFMFASGNASAIKAWRACVLKLDTLPEVAPSRMSVRDRQLTVGGAFHAVRLVDGEIDEDQLAPWMEAHVPRPPGGRAVLAGIVDADLAELRLLGMLD
jgi:hypothetical protein